MKEKIRIADIVNAFELGLIDREQTESKLFDLLVVGSTLICDHCKSEASVVLCRCDKCEEAING